MHTYQQLWLSWAAGEIDDATAQHLAEAEALRRHQWRQQQGIPHPSQVASHRPSPDPGPPPSQTSQNAPSAIPGRSHPPQAAEPDPPLQAPQNAPHSSSGDPALPLPPDPKNAPPPASGRNRRGHPPEATPRPPREKVFGPGRPVPLDRNAKTRVMVLARALARRTEPGRHYGDLTAKAIDVLQAILWGFHNCHSGHCYPSYETIADRAACSRTMVYQAIRMLEAVGLLTWVQRIKRIREYVPGLFGKGSASRWRVVRTSNAYAFNDPASKFKFQIGTLTQDSNKESFANNGQPVRPSLTASKQKSVENFGVPPP